MNELKTKTHAIVIAWVDKSGMRDTGRIERRDGNWFPVWEPCWAAKALVFSRRMDEKQRAKDHAKSIDSEFIRVLVLDDTDDILERAKATILSIVQETV